MVNARIKFTGKFRNFKDTMSIAQTFPKPLPAIQVPVPEKHYKIMHPTIKTGEGRLVVLRKWLTSLFREERIELVRHQAVAVRPYAERLIQMAIEYGNCHKATMDVCDYWLLEKDLIQKLFNVYVPRFQNCSTAYTRIFYFPTDYKEVRPHLFRQYTMAVLELRGNPYPPVVPKQESHEESLLNVLLKHARKQMEVDQKRNNST